MRDVNMAPILNRPEWKTRVTGRRRFQVGVQSGADQFQVRGAARRRIRLSGSERARARACYEPAQLKFDASGAAYGATRDHAGGVSFRDAGRPLSYALAGTFRDLDMRRLPERLSMPELETRRRARYQFEASGRDWRGAAQLDESTVEGARFAAGTLLGIQSRNRELSYSASGNVASLNPRRFAAPLEIKWLDDDRASTVR